MIVRLMGEGQWRLDDSLEQRLDELDAETERAVEAGDEQALHAALRALHETVRGSGEKLDHATSAPPTSSSRPRTSSSSRRAGCLQARTSSPTSESQSAAKATPDLAKPATRGPDRPAKVARVLEQGTACEPTRLALLRLV